MKCAKCGAELKKGCLYCSVCGHEAQMVNDYSALEEDYLKALLAEEAKNSSSTQKENVTRKKTEKHKKKKNQTPWIILVCTAVVAVSVSVAAIAYVKYKNNNSYDYQMEMAAKELTDRNYENALSYYKNALALAPDDIAVRIDMADVYMGQKEYESALVLYMETITLDKKNKEAYQGLITIYEEKGQYDKIKELAAQVTDKDLLELFSGYIVANPVFYPDAGTCDVYTEVTIFSIEDADIYYTIDGSDPTEEGILYTDDGIELDEVGSYTIKAACRNEKGIYSDVVTSKYKTKAVAPGYPKVSPDGGTVEGVTFVTITAEDDCSIYYTWDGSNPDTASELYTEPIEVPEGNNILSVIVINNKTKLASEVYRTNFICRPSAEE